MHFYQKRILLFSILLLLVGHASAERFAKVIYFQAPKGAPKHAFVYQSHGQGDAQQVSLKRRKFSASFKLEAGEQHLVFLPAVLPEGAEVPLDSPSVVIPEDWEQVILFVFENEQNPVMPIGVLAFDASEGTFGPGEIMFINQSDLIVGGLIAGEKQIIKDKTIKVVDPQLEERGEFNLILDSYNPTEKQKRNLIRKRWLHIPSFRNVVFITNAPPPRMAKAFVAEIRSF